MISCHTRRKVGRERIGPTSWAYMLHLYDLQLRVHRRKRYTEYFWTREGSLTPATVVVLVLVVTLFDKCLRLR